MIGTRRPQLAACRTQHNRHHEAGMKSERQNTANARNHQQRSILTKPARQWGFDFKFVTEISMKFEKGHKKFGGRTKGSLNKRTLMGMRLAEAIVTDEKYLKGLRADFPQGDAPPALQAAFWDRAFGRVLDPNPGVSMQGDTTACGRRSEADSS